MRPALHVACLLSLFAFVPVAAVSGAATSVDNCEADRNAPVPGVTWPDAAQGFTVLVVHTFSYDSVYSQNLRDLVCQHFPDARVLDFFGSDPAMLEEALSQSDILVVAYPTLKIPLLEMFDMGLVIRRFAASGGNVLITGSHDVRALRALQLLDVEQAYFSTVPMVHEFSSQVELLEGTPVDFELQNYAYPLVIRNPDYVSLAGLSNEMVYTYRDNSAVDSLSRLELPGTLSTLGTMPLGKGRVYYLGFEYFFDELPATRILTNAIRQVQHGIQVPAGLPEAADATAAPIRPASPASKTEQYLLAGSGNARIDLKVFPNPYMSSGNLEITLLKSTQVHVEIVDDQGRRISVLLPQRTLQQGLYRFELPVDIEPGIYFIKCHHDVHVDVRKVVKARAY